jgi:hypothetical protein
VKEEVNAKKADDVRRRIVDTSIRLDESFVDLAFLLEEAYRLSYHLCWRHSTFEEFILTETRLGFRKAMTLVAIGEIVIRMRLPKAKVRKVGVTRMGFLCRGDGLLLGKTKATALAAMRKAQGMASREVERWYQTEMYDLKARPFHVIDYERRKKLPLDERLFAALDQVPEFRRLSSTIKAEVAADTAHWIVGLFDDVMGVRNADKRIGEVA